MDEDLCNLGYCRAVINEPPPLNGLFIRIPVITPINGRGFINRGSALVYGLCSQVFSKDSKMNMDAGYNLT